MTIKSLDVGSVTKISLADGGTKSLLMALDDFSVECSEIVGNIYDGASKFKKYGWQSKQGENI